MVLLASTALVCLPVSAETIELPADLPLGVSSVRIDLWNADIDIIADPAASPILRARPVADEPGQTHLHRNVTDGVLTIRRRPSDDNDDDDDRLRLEVDVIVGAEQDVHLIGRDVRVSIREIRHPGVTDPRALQLTLEASELNMNGGRGAIIEARQTPIWLTDTRGQITLNLESGTAELRDHQGSVKLESTATEVTLVDFMGKLGFLVNGGSLDARGGSGSISGRADDAIVLLAERRGPFTLTGNNSTIEARGTNDDSSPWRLTGTDLQVTLEDHIGPVEGELERGRWDASSLGGTLTLTARRATKVELTDLAQAVVLELFDRTTARLTNLSGSVQAELRESRLEVDGIGPLTLVGEGSEIEVRQVQGKVDLTLTDSHLELDLTTNKHDFPSLVLVGGTARVRLRAPCEVRVRGDRDQRYDGIRISGCEFQLPGQPAPRRGHHLRGENRPMTLSVTPGPNVDLDVEGRS